MTISNFNWFLHTMLFLHTKHIIQRGEKKDVDENEFDDMEEKEE
jgi:hypothetical protein